jgi:hypothetical protein
MEVNHLYGIPKEDVQMDSPDHLNLFWVGTLIIEIHNAA